MKAIPYVSFNGNCEEAVHFYHSILGGELEILRWGDLPADKTFWNSVYGSVVDQFGVSWGVEFELK